MGSIAGRRRPGARTVLGVECTGVLGSGIAAAQTLRMVSLCTRDRCTPAGPPQLSSLTLVGGLERALGLAVLELRVYLGEQRFYQLRGSRRYHDGNCLTPVHSGTQPGPQQCYTPHCGLCSMILAKGLS